MTPKALSCGPNGRAHAITVLVTKLEKTGRFWGRTSRTKHIVKTETSQGFQTAINGRCWITSLVWCWLYRVAAAASNTEKWIHEIRPKTSPWMPRYPDFEYLPLEATFLLAMVISGFESSEVCSSDFSTYNPSEPRPLPLPQANYVLEHRYHPAQPTEK